MAPKSQRRDGQWCLTQLGDSELVLGVNVARSSPQENLKSAPDAQTGCASTRLAAQPSESSESSLTSREALMNPRSTQLEFCRGRAQHQPSELHGPSPSVCAFRKNLVRAGSTQLALLEPASGPGCQAIFAHADGSASQTARKERHPGLTTRCAHARLLFDVVTQNFPTWTGAALRTTLMPKVHARQRPPHVLRAACRDTTTHTSQLACHIAATWTCVVPIATLSFSVSFVLCLTMCLPLVHHRHASRLCVRQQSQPTAGGMSRHSTHR